MILKNNKKEKIFLKFRPQILMTW